MNMRIHRIALTVVTLGAAMLCAAPAVHATAGLAAGVTPKVISERLGHATVAFTLDTYTSALPRLGLT